MKVDAWLENGRLLLDTLGSRLKVREGRLWMGDRFVRDWAEALGTPCFLYDCAILDAGIDRLRAALPDDLRLHYAVKANPHPPLLAYLSHRVDGFDTASLGELTRLAEQGVDPRRCSLAGPAKSDAELAWALAHQVLVNVESAGEAARMAGLARQSGLTGRIALRLNPPFELKGSGMRMGGGANPFGIDAEQAGAVIDALDHKALSLEGFHLYAGSQCRDADVLAEGFERSLSLIAELCTSRGWLPKIVNLGGGFGIPYAPGDPPLALENLGAALKAMLAKWRGRFPETEFIIELGRYLVGEAGIYVTRVVDAKHSRGRDFLLCDGGMHHHLALSGNLGQVIRRNWPLLVADRMDDPLTGRFDLAGPLCTPLDVLGRDQPLPADTGPGDLIVVMQSGAYAASASPKDFLSRPAAIEHLVE